MIGGAKVDLDGRTSLTHLFACGEAAATSLHGANRLASNSLTEALVLGERTGRTAGEALNETNDRLTARQVDWSFDRKPRTVLDLVDIRNSLRSLMWRNVGIVRGGDRLTETLEIVNFWSRYCLDKEFFDPAGWEIQNMLTAAFVITQCALERTETRGVHYREDFPETDPTWSRHLHASRTQDRLLVK
jgi:L-aspartate oxidase